MQQNEQKTAARGWPHWLGRRLRCWWNGHELVNSSVEWVCSNCDHECGYHKYVEHPAKERIRKSIESIKNWWKCSDCGWRCGKHDPNNDHIPF